MLGNHADAFFTTPMRHTVVRGGNVGNQAPMPSPREVNSSATGKIFTEREGNFLPLSDVPASAAAVPAQSTILAAAFSPIGLGILAGVLFLTPLGKGLRRKVGLG